MDVSKMMLISSMLFMAVIHVEAQLFNPPEPCIQDRNIWQPVIDAAYNAVKAKVPNAVTVLLLSYQPCIYQSERGIVLIEHYKLNIQIAYVACSTCWYKFLTCPVEVVVVERNPPYQVTTLC